jgi:methylthioribose-1-phosphate isomerase
MLINGEHYRTIWLNEEDDRIVQIIDQRHLPHQFVIQDLRRVSDVARAIKNMHVRGAGLIGATAGYGMYLGTLEAKGMDSFKSHMEKVVQTLTQTRPTAANLSWAIQRQLKALRTGDNISEKRRIAKETANSIAREDAEHCRKIGLHGVTILQELSHRKEGRTVNILTHCNAGWLAFVDYGSALAPVYAAHDSNINLHVWVDETRPRNQGARLTAWELGNYGVPHTVIADNAGGHLMQHNMVDIVITGADRVTCTGDVANKIGTYLKALAAKDNNVPFYVAMPFSTIDWTRSEGRLEIPIEQRSSEEVKYIQGLADGKIIKVLLTPENSPAENYAFDVTPAHLITGFITERGIAAATNEKLYALYPEMKNNA